MKKIALIALSIIVISCSSSYEVVHIENNKSNERPIVYVKKAKTNVNEVFELISQPAKTSDHNFTLIEKGRVYKLKIKKELKLNFAAHNGQYNSNETLLDSISGYKVNGKYYCPDLFGLYLDE
ncbi:hypothetical protein [uncultured Psychroserpens sp.]|uniref:hypothetical protein n=1 Tax=uncultured Psychroserpens sp. TaxID=255436 RepID=UPI00261849E2|nr:hypothetical protein [uncultured Psychroserpens sp.]